MAYPSQLGFQDAASPVMEELLHFHDHALMVVFLISAFVLYIIVVMVSTKLVNKLILDSQEVEIIWTVLPAFILIFIALPSLRILYMMDEINDPHLTLKALGHQWYWSYEYSDLKDISFDSYITLTPDLVPGHYRLMEVDHRIVVPTEAPMRVLVSAEDVIHAWALPSLGIKVDAIPGRLNQTAMTANRSGVFYGQCSEICGANHSFMPITMESIPVDYFENWSLLFLD